VDVSTAYLENNISFGLKNIFGEAGAAIPIEVIKKVTQKVRGAIHQC
jgi:hypothetical protein